MFRKKVESFGAALREAEEFGGQVAADVVIVVKTETKRRQRDLKSLQRCGSHGLCGKGRVFWLLTSFPFHSAEHRERCEGLASVHWPTREEADDHVQE